jgi:hypothetical protein
MASRYGNEPSTHPKKSHNPWSPPGVTFLPRPSNFFATLQSKYRHSNGEKSGNVQAGLGFGDFMEHNPFVFRGKRLGAPLLASRELGYRKAM